MKTMRARGCGSTPKGHKKRRGTTKLKAIDPKGQHGKQSHCLQNTCSRFRSSISDHPAFISISVMRIFLPRPSQLDPIPAWIKAKIQTWEELYEKHKQNTIILKTIYCTNECVLTLDFKCKYIVTPKAICHHLLCLPCSHLSCAAISL